MSDVAGQGGASDVDFVALRPGQKIGRYEIVSILGQGAFGITYRATDSQLHRDVAIKEYLPTALAVRQDGATVLPRSIKMSDDFTWGRQRFVDEGRTLATLGRAPAIVRVFDFLEANGTAYIVMELAPGNTLEDRLKGGKTLPPAEIDKILWPLLDGLEQVHATGFLHRDIKPANILLDDAGNPTLIDFGASRVAMAGRTTAMTAIFTPGYAAAEQFTSAKQGPWTDIYGLSATLYHAITGAAPPSAYDRMLDDEYRPLSRTAPEGFGSGLLMGIDVGLTVRGTDRPQSIAGWRPLLAQTGAIDPNATMALGMALAKTADPNATIMVRQPAVAPPTPAKRGMGLWIGLGAVLLALAGGSYFMMAKKPANPGTTAEVESAEARAARAQAAELTKLRQEKEARDRADAEAAAKRKAEEETKRKAEDDDRRAAEAVELALRLSLADRQHIQVALTSLGFSTNGTDGVFGGYTRDMIAAWQKGHNYPATGFLTGPENEALLRDAAPAISRFDDDRKKADEEKARSDAAAKVATPPPHPAPSMPAPNTAAAAPKVPNGDGSWHGTYRCTPGRIGAGNLNINLQIAVSGGTGTWVRPGSGPGTAGIQSISLTIHGTVVSVARAYILPNQPGVLQTAQLSAHYDGANSITGGGPEANSGGRSCDINLTRQ